MEEFLVINEFNLCSLSVVSRLPCEAMSCANEFFSLLSFRKIQDLSWSPEAIVKQRQEQRYSDQSRQEQETSDLFRFQIQRQNLRVLI